MTGVGHSNEIMQTYKQKADHEIAATAATLEQARQQTGDLTSTPRQSLAARVGEEVTRLVINSVDMTDQTSGEEDVKAIVQDNLTTPPARKDYEWKPDYGLHTARLSNAVGVANPVEFARTLGSAGEDSRLLSHVGNVGPFINMRVADTVLVDEVREILNDSSETEARTGKTILVDFSSPNIAKPFGINHLRSTVIGESIARIKEATGDTVIRDNHLGDWGTQFGNLLAAYDEFGGDTPFEEMTTEQLNELYVRFSQEKKENPELVFKGREYFSRLNDKDPVLMSRWYSAVNASRKEFDEVYQRLGIKFDIQIGEAYYEDDASAMIDELRKDRQRAEQGNIVIGEDGTAYIDGEHPVPLRTQNGYVVYAGRDLATVKMRTETFKPDEVIYVVGEEQSTSFDAMFSSAEKLGLSSVDSLLTHSAFGLYLDENRKKLSSRKGTSGRLNDLLDEIEQHAYENLSDRNPGAEADSLRRNAEILGLDAIIWNDLQVDRKKSVIFDPTKMLSIGKGGVIDVLYTHVRSSRIVENLGDDVDQDTTLEALTNDSEHNLAVQLADFPAVLLQASEANAPHHLVTYLQELSRSHGAFYEQSPVAREEDVSTKNTRIMLHKAYLKVVEKGLYCLNIRIPDYL